MDHVSVVVEDLEGAIAFFVALGMELEGATSVEGPWVDAIIGIPGTRTDIAMVRTPDGHNRLELTRYRNPAATTLEPGAPPNTLGYRTVMFEVDDIDETVARMQGHGAELVGEIVDFESVYRLCYLRGPEGVLVALAQHIG